MKTATVFDPGLTHRGGWVACEQPPITLPPILAYTKGRQRQTEKQWVRKKKAWEEHESPGRKRGAGNDRDSDVISIRSRGERIFPALYSCSR